MSRGSFESTTPRSFFKILDYWILVPVLCICAIGLYVLNFVLETKFASSYPRNIFIQSGSVIIGLILMVVIIQMGTERLKLVGWVLYILSIVLQCLLPIFGDRDIAANTGSNSWLKLPLVGSMQPSEFSKVALCILIGYMLQRLKLKDYSYPKGFGLIALLVAPHAFLILAYQKDFGTMVVIFLMIAAMIFVWGIKLRYIGLMFSALVVAFPLMWIFYLKDYQKNRILSFLYPGFDQTASYNVDMAKRAIAMGGLTGNKTGEFIHVPVQESDFVFTAVAELMGLVGAGALILLIFLYLTRSVYVSSKALNLSEQYIGAGVTMIFAFHSIENIGMCIGLLPVTGIPLPFVSQGGSAMVANFIALGILMSISAHRIQRVKNALTG